MSSVPSEEDVTLEDFLWCQTYTGKYIHIDGVPRLVDSQTGDLLGPIVPTASMQDIGAPYLYEFQSSGEGSRIYHVGGEVPIGLGQYSDAVEANSDGVSIREEDWDPEIALRVLGAPARQRERMLWAQQREMIMAWSLDEAVNDFGDHDLGEGAAAAAGDWRADAGASTSYHTERAAAPAAGDGAEGAVALAGPSSNVVQHGPVENPIGRLNEYANQNKFPYPEYIYLQSKRKVQVHCNFLDFGVVAIQRTGKLAKRNAAQYMLYELQKCEFLQKSVAAPL